MNLKKTVETLDFQYKFQVLNIKVKSFHAFKYFDPFFIFGNNLMGVFTSL